MNLHVQSLYYAIYSGFHYNINYFPFFWRILSSTPPKLSVKQSTVSSVDSREYGTIESVQLTVVVLPLVHIPCSVTLYCLC